jgi:glutamyl-tRNA synthetase
VADSVIDNAADDLADDGTRIGPVRLRVAPSPTGDPHVGTAYVSLFDLAFVRQQGGQFVLRIEDTDRARFREDSEQQIFDTLKWLGLQWDEGPDIGGPFAPYRQSERLDTYAPYVERLLADGNAYHCWCTPERLTEMREAQQKAKKPPGYDRLCLGKTREERAQLPGFSPDPVVRMRIPADVSTHFQDLIRGDVNAPHPDDQVILKADGFPTYHLAVVVDDHLMGITHIVRGEEWISSTPKHILLYTWLGLTPPKFAHMPLLRNDDRSKISKRKNPAARLTWFREQGYLPEALVNFLGLMGYSMPDEREVFTFAEMSAEFDWSRVNVVGPIFNLDKLNWLNGHYIRALPVGDLADRIVNQLVLAGTISAEPTTEQREMIQAATPLVQERMQVLAEAPDMLGFLLAADEELAVDDDARKALSADAGATLAAARTALAAVPEWTTAGIEAALRAALVDGLGLKPRLAFTPLRVAVTGRRISPPLFESMELLGRESTLARVEALADDLALVPPVTD